MRRIAGIFGLTLALTVATAGVALAAYPPDAPSVGVSDATVRPGDSITVTGERWEGGTSVSLSFHSAVVSLGSVTTASDGSFSTSVTIPSSATPGTHQIVAGGIASSGRSATARTDITVLGGVVTAPGSTAFTGAHLDVWMVAALLLFVLGLGLLVASRRRVRASR
jgi:hypothetical protein